MNNLPQIPLWIRIETGHDSRLVDVPELKQELEELKIPVQLSYPWHPSFSTGLEFLFKLFANISIEDVIIQGAIYDGFKFALKKVFECLKSFAEKNKEDDFFPEVVIHLDDVVIKLNGSDYKSLRNQAEILEKLASNIKTICSQGIERISRIEIPCLPSYLPENEQIDESQEIWRIIYSADCCAYYNPETKKVF